VPKWIPWALRVLAAVKVADTVWFMSDAGWAESQAILVALAVAGFMGLAVVWLAGMVLKPGGTWLFVGALLLAVAPAMFYPLNFVILVLGTVALALASARASRPRVEAAN